MDEKLEQTTREQHNEARSEQQNGKRERDAISRSMKQSRGNEHEQQEEREVDDERSLAPRGRLAHFNRPPPFCLVGSQQERATSSRDGFGQVEWGKCMRVAGPKGGESPNCTTDERRRTAGGGGARARQAGRAEGNERCRRDIQMQGKSNEGSSRRENTMTSRSVGGSFLFLPRVVDVCA